MALFIPCIVFPFPAVLNPLLGNFTRVASSFWNKRQCSHKKAHSPHLILWHSSLRGAMTGGESSRLWLIPNQSPKQRRALLNRNVGTLQTIHWPWMRLCKGFRKWPRPLTRRWIPYALFHRILMMYIANSSAQLTHHHQQYHKLYIHLVSCSIYHQESLTSCIINWV